MSFVEEAQTLELRNHHHVPDPTSRTGVQIHTRESRANTRRDVGMIKADISF